MIYCEKDLFLLSTRHYSCLLRVNPYGLLEQLHFGAPIRMEDARAMTLEQGLGWGSAVLLDPSDTASCMDAMALAWSGSGWGFVILFGIAYLLWDITYGINDIGYWTLFQNDQLLWTTLSMALFMVGYCTTVNFAIYYMKYIFGNEGMYTILVAVVGVSQLGTLSVYPLVAKKFNRRQLYTLGTALVIVGYLIFFFAEISLVLIVLGAVLVFVGQAFIQTLMLMFLADTVEYGQEAGQAQ